MINIIKNIGKAAKYTLAAGWGIAIIMLIISAVIYFGAGKIFDYYPAIELCGKLLAAVRPVFVVSSAISVSLEYYGKCKNQSE